MNEQRKEIRKEEREKRWREHTNHKQKENKQEEEKNWNYGLKKSWRTKILKYVTAEKIRKHQLTKRK